MFTMMPVMMLGDGWKSHAVGGAALLQGELYVVERSGRFGRPSGEASRSQLVKAGSERLEEVVPLRGWVPDLLADGDRLWLISSSSLAVFDDGGLNTLSTPEPLGDICRPFLFQGFPTVVENRPDGGRLASWKSDRWKTILDLPAATGRCRLQALAVGDRVWMFRRDGETLYVQDAMSEDRAWNVVLSRPSEWYAFTRSGRPAVASSDFENGFRIVQHDGERWDTVASSPESLGITSDRAIFENDDASLWILPKACRGLSRCDGGTAIGPRSSSGSAPRFPFPHP